MSETRNDAVIRLLTEIRDELKKMNNPPKPKPRNLPPPPTENPMETKKKLFFNEALNSWQWENDK
jgi:hypothetical protein